MKNNEYKKYFDQVSPEQNLIEETKKKMLDEINKPLVCSSKNTRVSFIRYGILTACAAAAAVSVALVPKPANTHISDSDNCSGNNQVDRSFTTVTDLSATTIISSKKTSSPIKNPNYSENIENTCQTPVTPNNADSVNDTDTTVPVTEVPTQSITRTIETAVPQYTSAPSQTAYVPPQTRPQTDSIHTAPQCTVVVTAPAGYRPGASGGNQEGGPVNTPMVTQPCCLEQIYKIEKAEISGIETDIYVNVEYDYIAPLLKNTTDVSAEDAAQYFGDGYCPGNLSNMYPDFKMKMPEEYGLEDGMCMIFGEHTGLDEKNSKFAVVTLSKGYTNLKYAAFSYKPLLTVINGTQYSFTALSQYNDVYFCSFEKNGFYYDLCFKGFDLDQIIETLLSF